MQFTNDTTLLNRLTEPKQATADPKKAVGSMFISILSKSGSPMAVPYILDLIKNGEYNTDALAKVRELKAAEIFDKEAYDKAKRKLALHCFTGQFVGGHGIANLTAFNGLVILDFDKFATHTEFTDARAALQADRHCLALWVSPGAKGYKMLVRVPLIMPNEPYDEPNNDLRNIEYNRYFYGAENHFKGLGFDNRNTGINRACLVSYDPDLFTNWDAEIFTKQAENTKVLPPPTRKAPQQKGSGIMTDSGKIFETLLKAEGANVDLSDGWNAGVHFLASRCNDYNIPQHEAEGLIWNHANIDNTEYEGALKTIRSAYKQPSANKTYNLPRQPSKPVKRPKTTDTDIERHIDALYKFMAETASMFSAKDGIIYDLVSSGQIYRNLLTGKVEFSNGRELADSDINTLTLKARGQSKDISTDAVLRVIFSDHTPSYHPFEAYVNQLPSRPLKTGVVDAFLSCLKLQDDHSPEYLQRIVKKWFGGLMGTLCGSYSVMTLVFIGAQGNGKTTFFRNLLPDDLKKYFAECEIKDDKDVYARMCQNFIVYSDEFTSKNKTEASAYKMISSADKFTYRKPYGKMDETRKRTAVLCGSANEGDILSDPTGNRRIIPVRLKGIDHKALSKIDINDLYRELLDMHKTDPIWWHLSAEDIALLNADTVQNEAVDEWAELVARYTDSSTWEHTSVTQVSTFIAARDQAYRPNIHKLGRALTAVYGGSVQGKVNNKNMRGYKLRLVESNRGNS